jgi:hypothetical protein
MGLSGGLDKRGTRHTRRLLATQYRKHASMAFCFAGLA